MFIKEKYENIHRQIRLMAALHSYDYKKCNLAMSEKQLSYSPDEKRRIMRALKENRKYVLIGDENYPAKLYDMEWPPLVLFYEGDLGLLNRPSIGIVGSRNCSVYGRKITMDLAGSLSKIGFVIISGGARGIDTAAHRTALGENGKTVCVLGCGLDISYPGENEEMFSVIKKEGLVITQYPKGFGPRKWTFPMRNRIIAALSDEIIVTEAAEKSGSLHTASYGEELNRPVHSIPHDVYSVNGSGTNLLIEMGAQIMYKKENLLSDLLTKKPDVLLQRIRDLNLLELNPSLDDLEKIFCLGQVQDSYWKKKLESDLKIFTT
jgi:DNA processing protein